MHIRRHRAPSTHALVAARPGGRDRSRDRLRDPRRASSGRRRDRRGRDREGGVLRPRLGLGPPAPWRGRPWLGRAAPASASPTRWRCVPSTWSPTGRPRSQAARLAGLAPRRRRAARPHRRPAPGPLAGRLAARRPRGGRGARAGRGRDRRRPRSSWPTTSRTADCGQHSSGGASSAGAYRAWIAQLARGIGGAPGDRRARARRPGRHGLPAAPRTAPSGSSSSPTPSRASRPSRRPPSTSTPATRAGSRPQAHRAAPARGRRRPGARLLGQRRGLRHHRARDRLRARGVARTGGARFVIDTSRNGLGPTAPGEWCNPPGRALGDRPRPPTRATPLVDGHLWIKRPGESDGAVQRRPAGRRLLARVRARPGEAGPDGLTQAESRPPGGR